jgi:ribosomal protein L40E
MEVLGVPLLVIPFILLWVYVLNKKNGVLERLDKPSKYKCSECLGRIPAGAKKCKHCGSTQEAVSRDKKATNISIEMKFIEFENFEME